MDASAPTNIRTPMRPLTSFAVSPDGVRFETQEADEEVVLFLRQHSIFLLPSLILVVILIIAPTVIFPFLLRLILPVTLPSGYIVVGIVFWYVMTLGVALVSFLRWFFNIYIVTNERIIDIDFIHLLYKEFSEARLAEIQDITYKRAGILASLFDYGNVSIQTAGTLPNIEFLAVPKPSQVVEIISALSEKAKGEKP